MPDNHIGDWHTVTITTDPEETDLLDIAVAHPDTCPPADDAVEPWACDLQAALDCYGYHELFDGIEGMDQPSVWRVRWRVWPLGLPTDVTGPPQEAVGVEAARVDDEDDDLDDDLDDGLDDDAG